MREDGALVSFALRFASRTPTPPIGWNPQARRPWREKFERHRRRSGARRQGREGLQFAHHGELRERTDGGKWTAGSIRVRRRIDPQKQLVSDLITSFGYAVIDLGDFDEGGCFQQPRGPLAGKDLICCSQAEARRGGQRSKGTGKLR